MVGALFVGAIGGLFAAVGGTKSIVVVPGIAVMWYLAVVPFSALYMIVSTTPINVVIAGPITVSRVAIVLGAFTAFVQVSRGVIPLPRIAIWPWGTLAMTFFLWLVVATLGAGGGGYVAKLGPWFIYAIIFWLILNYAADFHRMRNLFLLLGLVGILQALLVLAENFFGFSPFGGWQATLAEGRLEEEVRVVGTSSHPIILAGFFQVVLGVQAALAYAARDRWTRLFWLIGLAVVVLGWWFTFSRSSWIGMSQMILVGMLLASRVTRRLGIVAAIVGISVLSFFDFSPKKVVHFVESFGTIQTASRTAGVAAADESLGWRTENWRAAFNIFLGNPLFGVGLDASKAHMLANLPKGALAHQYISPEVPHNMFLLVLSETGIVSFSLFMALWFAAFRAVFRARAYAAFRPYAIALAAVMAGQVTTFFFNPMPREVWLTMGIAMAMERAISLMPAHRARPISSTPTAQGRERHRKWTTRRRPRPSPAARVEWPAR